MAHTSYKTPEYFLSPLQSQPVIGAFFGLVLGSIVSPLWALVGALNGFVALFVYSVFERRFQQFERQQQLEREELYKSYLEQDDVFLEELERKYEELTRESSSYKQALDQIIKVVEQSIGDPKEAGHTKHEVETLTYYRSTLNILSASINLPSFDQKDMMVELMRRFHRKPYHAITSKYMTDLHIEGHLGEMQIERKQKDIYN